MQNEDIILSYRDLFGKPATADEVLANILDALSSDKRTAEMAAEAVSEIGPVTDAVIPALIKNLYHDERASRAMRSALRSMGDLALQQLLSELPEAPRPLRYFMIKAIGEFGPAAKRAVPDLQSICASADAIDRMYAAMALVSTEGYRPELCIEIAKAFTGSGYTEIEIEFAMGSLADFGNDAAAALPIIVLGLIRLDDFFARGPAMVLNQIGSRAVSAIPALLQRTEEYAENSLQRIVADVRQRGELNESLEAALATQDSAMRLQSSCLAIAKTTRALDELSGWLNHSDLHMRLGTIAALGSFGEAASPQLDRLRPFLDSDNSEECLHAAIACWQIGGSQPEYERIATLAMEDAKVTASTKEWLKRILSSNNQ